MTRIFTEADAQRDLRALLDHAGRGEAYVQANDGRSFVVKPVDSTDVPKDYEAIWSALPVIDLGVTHEEIVQIIREGRDRQYE